MNFIKKHRSSESAPKMQAREKENGSPVSVLCESNLHQSPRKAAKVTMSDSGAEVTLSSPSSKASRFYEVTLTPDVERDRRNILSNLPTHSLLDNEFTPSPLRASPQKQQNMWVCGSHKMGCYSCDEDGALVSYDAGIERTINNFLSTPIGLDEWCTSWQAWTYYEMDMPESSSSKGGLKATIKRELRNRAGTLGARASRVTSIQRDLNPFDVTPQKKKIPLNKANSFCIGADNRAPPQLEEKRHKPRAPSLASILEACTAPNNVSPFVIRTRGLADELFYDSDPEENTKKRSPSRRPVGALTEEWMTNNSEEDDVVSLDFDKINLNDSVRVHDHVQEVLNRRYTLVWHPESESKPIAINAWFERGQHLPSGLKQPRLVWTRQNREGKIGGDKLHNVDLLDVSRVLEVSRVDRNHYPMAQRKKCFLLQSLDQKLMFEARSEKDRDRVCQDFKLVVARLGSQIIMEDPEVFSEFFIFDGGVPGGDLFWIK